MPALTAGPSGCGSTTRAPCALFIPKPSAMPVVTDWTCTPIQPCLTTPLSLSWATTIFTVSEGIATEPPDGENIAVLTATTLPSTSKAGPPELPSLTQTLVVLILIAAQHQLPPLVNLPPLGVHFVTMAAAPVPDARATRVEC